MTGGPWTRSMKVVHGPGPKRGSMDPWSMFCPHPVASVSKLHHFVVQENKKNPTNENRHAWSWAQRYKNNLKLSSQVSRLFFLGD